MTFIEEIQQQPQALRDFIKAYFDRPTTRLYALNKFLTEKQFNKIIFSGMGSSLFASYVPCYYLWERGVTALALESNELMGLAQSIIDENTLLVLVSQSGASAEPVALASEGAAKSDLVVVTNNETSPLAQLGDMCLLIYAGTEKNTASKTYTNTIAVLLLLAHMIRDRDQQSLNCLKSALMKAAEVITKQIDRASDWLPMACDFIGDSSYLAVIGSGASYATASQGELVMVEAARISATRYTTGQFIHGPTEAINSNYRAIAIDVAPFARGNIDKIVHDVCRFGGKIFLLTNRHLHLNDPNIFIKKIDVDEPIVAPVVEIVPIELLANELGLRKNLRPGVLLRTRK